VIACRSADDPRQGRSDNIMPNYFFLIWVALIGAMFYFMMIKPAKRQRAQQFNLLEHLTPGSEVRTASGILGTAVEVADDYVVIETTPGVRIKVIKQAVAGIILPDEADDTVLADVPTPGGIGDAPAGLAPDVVETAVQDAVPAEATADGAVADAAEPAAKS
jgi:preprotein translocase subunit YajC